MHGQNRLMPMMPSVSNLPTKLRHRCGQSAQARKHHVNAPGCTVTATLQSADPGLHEIDECSTLSRTQMQRAAD